MFFKYIFLFFIFIYGYGSAYGVSFSKALDLSKKHAPVVILYGDSFTPCAVEEYIEKCKLWGAQKKMIADVGRISADHLKQADKDSYLDPVSSENYQGAEIKGKSLFSLFKKNNGRLTAPVYVNVHEKKEGGYLLQYWFFYPYNGDIVLKIGTHEGDWEHVDVHLDRNEKLTQVFFARHRQAVHGAMHEAKDLEMRDGHFVVYSARHGHASYAHHHIINKSLDLLNKNGPQWKTWENVVLIDDQPWAMFKGRWGKDQNSPRGPRMQNTFIDEKSLEIGS